MKLRNAIYIFSLITLTATISACSGNVDILDANANNDISSDISEGDEICNPLFGNCEDTTLSCAELNNELNTLADRLTELKESNADKLTQIEAATGQRECNLNDACKSQRRKIARHGKHLERCRSEIDQLFTNRDELKGKIKNRVARLTWLLFLANGLHEGLLQEDAGGSQAYECKELIDRAKRKFEENYIIPKEVAHIDIGDADEPEGETAAVNITLSDNERAVPEAREVVAIDAPDECANIAQHVTDARTMVATLEAKNEALDKDLDELQKKFDDECSTNSSICDGYSALLEKIDRERASCNTVETKLTRSNGEIGVLKSTSNALRKNSETVIAFGHALDRCEELRDEHEDWESGQVILTPTNEAQAAKPPLGSDSPVPHDPNLQCPNNFILAGLGVIANGNIKSINIMCQHWSKNSGLSGEISWAGRLGESGEFQILNCPSGYAIGGISGTNTSEGSLGSLIMECTKVGSEGTEEMRDGNKGSMPLRIYKNFEWTSSYEWFIKTLDYPIMGLDGFGTVSGINNILDFNKTLKGMKTNRCTENSSVATGIYGLALKGKVNSLGLMCSSFERKDGKKFKPTVHIIQRTWNEDTTRYVPEGINSYVEDADEETPNSTASQLENDRTDFSPKQRFAMTGIRFSFSDVGRLGGTVDWIKPTFNKLTETWKRNRNDYFVSIDDENGISHANKSNDGVHLQCPAGYLITAVAYRGDDKMHYNPGIRCSPMIEGSVIDLSKSIWSWKINWILKTPHWTVRACEDEDESTDGLSRWVATGMIGKTQGNKVDFNLGLQCAQLPSTSSTQTSNDDDNDTSISDAEYQRRYNKCLEEGFTTSNISACLYNPNRWE